MSDEIDLEKNSHIGSETETISNKVALGLNLDNLDHKITPVS
jgi:hypothetical protein